jgi:hypothetical protein
MQLPRNISNNCSKDTVLTTRNGPPNAGGMWGEKKRTARLTDREKVEHEHNNERSNG